MASVSTLVDTQPPEKAEGTLAASSPLAQAAPPKRTLGLKLTDWGIYGVLSNTTVFGLSVLFTYMTGYGHLRQNKATKELLKPVLNASFDAKVARTAPQMIEELRAAVAAEKLAAGEAERAIKEIHKKSAYLADAGKDTLDTMAYTQAQLNDPNHELRYGSFGAFFQRRGQWLVNQFETRLGMSKDAANNLKMVTFSFLDGSLILPVVTWLEGFREPIARWFDRRLGTESQDPQTYASEPQQSGWSILGGRVLTLSAVLGTYKVLEATYLRKRLNLHPLVPQEKSLVQMLTRAEEASTQINGIKNDFPGWKADAPAPIRVAHTLDDTRTINTALLVEPSAALEKKWKGVSGWLQKKGVVPEGVFKVGIFEFVYTAICTVGLYFASRMIAGGRKVREPEAQPKPLAGEPVLVPQVEAEHAKPKASETKAVPEPVPSPKIKEAASFARVQDVTSPELAAL